MLYMRRGIKVSNLLIPYSEAYTTVYKNDFNDFRSYLFFQEKMICEQGNTQFVLNMNVGLVIQLRQSSR